MTECPIRKGDVATWEGKEWTVDSVIDWDSSWAIYLKQDEVSWSFVSITKTHENLHVTALRRAVAEARGADTRVHIDLEGAGGWAMPGYTVSVNYAPPTETPTDSTIWFQVEGP